jgi:hypothetical protein
MAVSILACMMLSLTISSASAQAGDQAGAIRGLLQMIQDQPVGYDPKAHIANTVSGKAMFIGLLTPTNQPQRPPPTVG